MYVCSLPFISFICPCVSSRHMPLHAVAAVAQRPLRASAPATGFKLADEDGDGELSSLTEILHRDALRWMRQPIL